MEMISLSLVEARALAYKALRRNGFSEAHATVAATDVTRGERDGCASHGSRRLLGIAETRCKGKVSPNAEPVIIDIAPAIVKVNAGGTFSLLASERALPPLIEKARHNDIAALAVSRCVHFSALFANVEPLTEVGLVVLATTPDHAWVAPVGGTQPLFGTNPTTFGQPREEKPPFIFDMAISVAARGEIRLHQRVGKMVPGGWGIDGDSQTTTNARATLDGTVLTFGGHKESALMAVVELLVGPLIGDMTSAGPLAWNKRVDGLLCDDGLTLILDPARFLGLKAPQHLACIERLFADTQWQGARLPGERRYHSRTCTTYDGVEIAHSLFKDISVLVKQLSREQGGRCPPCYACIATYSFFTPCFERSRPARIYAEREIGYDDGEFIEYQT